jgi:hypothetical protein
LAVFATVLERIIVTTVDSPAPSGIAPALRRLYFVRFAFAIVWAVLLFVTSKSQVGPIGVALVVLYPLFDVAAAVVDARSSRATGSARGLIVAVRRRTMGGQWPMILSGGISVLAGANFVIGASAANPSLSNVAGYAVLGGIFFLVSALRLGRAAKGN